MVQRGFFTALMAVVSVAPLAHAHARASLGILAPAATLLRHAWKTSMCSHTIAKNAQLARSMPRGTKHRFQTHSAFAQTQRVIGWRKKGGTAVALLPQLQYHSCKKWQSDEQLGKPCQQSCFDAGAGYLGDDCAVEKACAMGARGAAQVHAQVERAKLIMNTATRHLNRRRSKVCTCAFGTPAGAAKCVYSEENCMSCENGYSLKRAKGAVSGREVAICEKIEICKT